MFKVILKFNQAVIKVHEITKPEFTFGRAEDNDIPIDNPAVSGHHGKIMKVGDHYEVNDLGSTNGTYVNGRPIKNSRIKNKDQIRVARHILEIWSDEDPPEPEPEKPTKSEIAKPKAVASILSQAAAEPQEVPKHMPPLGDDGAPVNKTILPPATIKVIAGQVGDQSAITLGPHVSYIGTSDQAVIKIKGFMAPSLAAAITRRPDGYFLKAVKAGYPKVNGMAVEDQVMLESGALIEVGGTHLLFSIEGKKSKEEA